VSDASPTGGAARAALAARGKDRRMQSAVTIFLVGIGGVFIGMGMLYVAIRTTAALVGRRRKAPTTGTEG